MSEEKRKLGDYEIIQSIYIGDKEVVFGVDKKDPYPFTALMRNSDSSYRNYLPRKTIRSGLRCFMVSPLVTAKS